MNLAAVHTLVHDLEHKDGVTAAHTWRVALYARAMAEHFGVDAATVERWTVAAALHDVGKLDVPDSILKKPGPLSEQEWDLMRRHTVWGERRLHQAGIDDPLALELVRWHHERVDGRGYPDGLVGAAIPMSARSFAVIDAFDAMTSARPYRDSLGPANAENALAEIERGRGTRYCVQCADAFVALFRQGRLNWILEYFNDRSEPEPFGIRPPGAAAASPIA